MIDQCNLLDLDFFGTRFTWQHGCRGGRLVSCRLDRGLCDHLWRMEFPEASVEHLMRGTSDHNPLLLRCSNMLASRQERPFRFLAAWCGHPDYGSVVREA